MCFAIKPRGSQIYWENKSQCIHIMPQFAPYLRSIIETRGSLNITRKINGVEENKTNYQINKHAAEAAALAAVAAVEAAEGSNSLSGKLIVS